MISKNEHLMDKEHYQKQLNTELIHSKIDMNKVLICSTEINRGGKYKMKNMRLKEKRRIFDRC